jgi:hypothetical protein
MYDKQSFFFGEAGKYQQSAEEQLKALNIVLT